MSEPMIEYRCGEPKHVASIKDGAAPRSPVTVVDGKWAYCPMGAASEHKWELIRPTALSGLSVTRVIRRSVEVIGR
jgi:hypothetical protein